MVHSSNATRLVSEFEGCKLKSYQDVAGIWTIGYGHTGRHAAPGNTITQSEAIGLLNNDLTITDHAINRLVKVPLKQQQFDALVSFVFNIGQGHFSTSSCLALLNEKNYALAAEHMLLWDKAAGKVCDGLVRRRLQEKALFESV